MPKAKITFDLRDHEEVQIFKRYTKSEEMCNLLFEIRYNLFSRCNETIYAARCNEDLDCTLVLEAEDAIEMVFQMLNDLYEDHNINIDELM